jgi:hypothetical protein
MSHFSFPVERTGNGHEKPAGRMLVVGSAGVRAVPVHVLKTAGYATAEAEDPYAAMAELCERPGAYSGLVLSLNGLYREELQMISAVKRRLPEVEVWLSHTDGRPAALAEALRLGADGLLSEEGLHRMAAPPPARPAPPAPAAPMTRVEIAAPRPAPEEPVETPSAEPVLTAEELRALLQEIPAKPAAPEEHEPPSEAVEEVQAGERP